jgi:hypothetical protein
MMGKIELNSQTTIHRNNNFQTFAQALIVLFRLVAMNIQVFHDETVTEIIFVGRLAEVLGCHGNRQ